CDPRLNTSQSLELAFLVAARRGALGRSVAAGVAVATIGLAGAWAWSHVWGWHPWQAELLPMVLAAGALAAVGAALLGYGFGRVVSHHASGLRARHVIAGFAMVLVALALPFPRNVPDGSAVVRTAPAGDGLVEVTVEVSPPNLVAGASRWEVMAWQNDGHVNAPLVEVAPGRYTTAEPVPVGASWKTVARLAAEDQLGGIPIYMPEDPAIDASEVPVAPTRDQAFTSEAEYLLREAHGGPAWPGIVAYTAVFTGIIAILGLIVAGAVRLERRRRALGWTRDDAPLAGKRVVISGASGGIGVATRTALEAQGARVIGLDLIVDRPDTLVVDVTDTEAVVAAVDEAAARLGGIDAVIANAGIGDADDSTRPPSERARDVLEVNLLGAWNTIAAALPHLGDGGVVVGITSGLASAAVPYAAAYTASKRGLSGYLDVLRLELEGRIDVVEVQPAYIRTAIHDGPAQRGASLDGLVRAEDVTDAAAAVVTALEAPRRRLGSSPLATFELALARRAPRLVERLVRRQLRRVEAAHGRPEFTSPEVRTPAR
ncbi:MAG: SDR family NAD(P)-dependent oxidoreductase, partial [Actinobacteria bacterium]|nr:SDR family NAD(P)-dependent oxidoreductase [Actinomycetota bacterium]